MRWFRLGIVLVLAVVVLAFLCGKLLIEVRQAKQKVEELAVRCQSIEFAIDNRINVEE